MNVVAKGALFAFASGFGLIFAAAFASNFSESLSAALAMTAVAMLVPGAIVYITAIIIRDATAQRWRFSLAAVLVAMTCAAVILAVITIILRSTSQP